MKTLLRIFGLALLLTSKTAMSQEERPFRLGLGTGLVVPQHYFPGFLLYVEPSIRIQNYSIGLRLETVGRPDADIGILGSYSINGQYYFNEGATRFFGGLGFGLYTINSGLLASCTCEDQLKNTVVGFYPRVGLERKHMVVILDFNITQTATQKTHHDEPMPNALPSYYQASPSYISLKIGWFIKGGKKERISRVQ